MISNPEIEYTADGSHTLFIPALDEHYHSVNGAIQESQHVFINTGLNNCNKDQIHLFEVGFGTGLNAFLSLLNIKDTHTHIFYHTIENYPLSSEIIKQLNYPSSYSKEEGGLYFKLHDVEWNKEIEITPNFTIHKINDSLIDYDFDSLQYKIDLVYFDAFAPDKQADMWTQDIFDSIYSKCADGALLVTYCAKGVVRRMMQSSGFVVERLAGPPGKREMLRATK